MTVPLKVLHLEDDRRDADLAEATLAADGLDVRIVRVDSRNAFVDALESEAFDVILADYNLPAFDGLTAQAITAETRPDIPFIFLSGTLGEDLAVERLKAGATDYVLKQRIARLPSAVRRALAEARERAERRRADSEILRLNAELEQRVIERTAELAVANTALARRETELSDANSFLQQAKEEAERANRAKSDFLSRMSHDLRTPLNAVLGFAQLLEADHISNEQREAVGQIMRGGRHLLGLINEVLDIARIEAGQLSLSPESVDADEIARDAVNFVTPLATERGITLQVVVADRDRTTVHADRQRLNQVILNLLSNAVKYSRTGGDVTVGIQGVGKTRVRISVADNGAGIPPEKLKLLFKPFERLGAEQTGIEGTGLGLALARGLTEAMRGTLGVNSEVDRGSVFWIELPLGTADVLSQCDAAAARPRISVDATAQGTVLYIEDNSSNVRLMQRVMNQRPGVTLLHAAQGSAGVSLAKQSMPDLILLDLHLPDMHGEQVLHHLWEDPQLRVIPVAILSADATPSQARRLTAAGASAYLTKPLDIPQVLAFIDRSLSRGPRPVTSSE